MVYCGNNYFKMGRQPLGTPYECLKKGVGAGLHGDLKNFSPRYRPIFPNDKFCGIKKPPPGKVRGKPHECLSKGYGIGLQLQYTMKQSTVHSTVLNYIFILSCIVIILVFVHLIFRQWFLTFIIFIGALMFMYYLSQIM